MTRIDLHTPPPAAVVTPTPSGSPSEMGRSHSTWLTRLMRAILWKCVKLVIGLAILAAPIVYLLLAAGIMTIPLIGGFFYHPPEPDHTVIASAPLDEAALQSLSFSESMLTASLRLGLQGEGSQLFNAEASQVAVIEGRGIELFLPLAHNAQDSALVIELIFNLENGQLVPVVTSLHLGQLPIAPTVVNAIVTSSLQSAIDSFNAELAKVVQIEAISYKSGSVVITAQL